MNAADNVIPPMELTHDLEELRRGSPILAEIVESFALADQVYREALQAMGQPSEHVPVVKNTAEVTLSIGSTSTDKNLIMP